MDQKLQGLSTEKMSLLEEGTLLPVMEQFYTIQGEGYNTGKPAWFIRIGGCDVGCHWCDVKESWDAGIHPLTPLKEILENAMASGAKSVVVTGGEPLMYNLGPLTAALREKRMEVFVETSGAYPLSGDWDWICLSPKKNMLPVEEFYKKADELKIIVYNWHDFKWAEEQASKTGKNTRLFLQPEWSRSRELLPDIISYVKEHQQWRISLQTHKYMHIP